MRVGKEVGHEQMLGQAAAVLVSLSTLLTSEVIGIGLLPITFDQLLTLASSPHARLVKASIFFIHLIILVILDSTLISLRFVSARH
jgi:hypothetical protein